MFVCVCKAVSDRTIDQAISTHGPCAETVGFETGAGTRCGNCRPWIENRCAQSRGDPAMPTVPLSATREVMYGRVLPCTATVHDTPAQPSYDDAPAVVEPMIERCA